MSRLQQVILVLKAHNAYSSYRSIDTEEKATRFVEDVLEENIDDSSWSMCFERFELSFASFWDYQQEWAREYRSMYS